MRDPFGSITVCPFEFAAFANHDLKTPRDRTLSILDASDPLHDHSSRGATTIANSSHTILAFFKLVQERGQDA